MDTNSEEDDVNSMFDQCDAMDRIMSDFCLQETGISCSMMQGASKQFESLNWTEFVHVIANDIYKTMDEEQAATEQWNELIVSINKYDMQEIKVCLKKALHVFVADILSDIIIDYLFYNATSVLQLLEHNKTRKQFTQNDLNKITTILSTMAILIIDKRSNDWFGIPLKKSDLIHKYSTVPFGCSITIETHKWCMFWSFTSVTNQFHTLCSKCREYFCTLTCFNTYYSQDEGLLEAELAELEVLEDGLDDDEIAELERALLFDTQPVECNPLQ
eukprot:32172_1